MIRPPPRSPLFPYPPLSRSDLVRHEDHVFDPADVGQEQSELVPADPRDGVAGAHRGPQPLGGAFQQRSEEHTSELQSQSNLVCRLLLEKKKKKKTRAIPK